MNSIRILVSMLLAMLACVAANAQAVDEPMRHWQGYIETSFQNTMSLGFEVGIKYYPIRYVGIGAGVGIGGDIGELGTITFEAGDMMVIADDGNGVAWFSTGLQLQSPALWHSSDGDGGLSLKADVGIRLPVPANDKLGYRAIPNAAGTWDGSDWQYERSHGGKSCFLYFKPSVAYDIHRCQIWLGYLWSNMDPYSGVRNVTILGHHLDFPRKRPMNGLTIGFGYRF